jgi:hypothetical protein
MRIRAGIAAVIGARIAGLLFFRSQLAVSTSAHAREVQSARKFSPNVASGGTTLGSIRRATEETDGPGRLELRRAPSRGPTAHLVAGGTWTYDELAVGCRRAIRHRPPARDNLFGEST